MSAAQDTSTRNGELVLGEVKLVRGSRQVLDGIGLAARPGQLLALVGPNGAGKSSLLSVLAGLSVPTQGRVTLDGRPLGDWPVAALARRRAMLSQMVHAGFGFSAIDMVLLGRSAHAGSRDPVHDCRIAQAALRATQAWHLRERNCLHLSGGEQRRVQLARVLAQVWTPPPGQSAWLLLDEPEAGLDIAHQHAVLQLARRWTRRGYGVIAVLHDLNLAARYADQVALLAQGRLLRLGPPGQALDPAILSPVYGIGMRRSVPDAGGMSWIMAGG